MKDSLLVISLVINVIICISIPLGVFIYILLKKRAKTGGNKVK